MAKRNEGTGTHRAKEGGWGAALAEVEHLETLVEVDKRYRLFILGLHGVLEVWFQRGNWQFTYLWEEPASHWHHEDQAAST